MGTFVRGNKSINLKTKTIKRRKGFVSLIVMASTFYFLWCSDTFMMPLLLWSKGFWTFLYTTHGMMVFSENFFLIYSHATFIFFLRGGNVM